LSIFSGKKVLVTGHTGFKGSWLALWLRELGAEVYGLSNGEVSSPSNYSVCNITDFVREELFNIIDAEKVENFILDLQPDFVFHLAAQALVRESYKNPLETISTNVVGTSNILNALIKLQKKVVAIMITSDKAYDNVEWVWGYRETDRIGGKDPYSASKGMAEIAIRSYYESFLKNIPNIRLGITRAGNVIGGGDWATDRIVPDCVVAWSKGETVQIRNPYATRPWQHVLEPLSGYIALANNLFQSDKNNGQAFNFGPSADTSYSVEQLIIEMSKTWSNVKWSIDNEKSRNFHEAGLLKLNCDKALYNLDWKPTLHFNEVVEMTISWYKNYYVSQKSMTDFTIKQINQYCEIAEKRTLSWINDVK